jgi:general secretion pathway protein C
MMTLLRTGFHLLALSVIIFLVVDLFYTVVEERLGAGYRAETVTSSGGEAEATRRPAAGDYKVIAERNVFGAIEEETAEEMEEEPEELEPTKLNVALLGTVFGTEEDSLAVIWDGARKTEDFYRVGDGIQGAVLKKIRRGEVILRVGGRDEILKMKDVDSPDAGDAGPPAVASRPAAPAEARPPVETETDITVSRADVEEGLQSINELFTQARIRPHFVDGRPDGLAITHVRPDSIFSRMGLRNGDVIKGLDGRPIASPNDALELFRNLRAGSSFSLEVSRRGTPTQINYNFE